MPPPETPSLSVSDRAIITAFQNYLDSQLKGAHRVVETLAVVATYLASQGDVDMQDYKDKNPASFSRLRVKVNEAMDLDDELPARARAYVASIDVSPEASEPEAKRAAPAKKHGRRKSAAAKIALPKINDELLFRYKDQFDDRLVQTVGITVTDEELSSGGLRIEPYDTIVDQYITAVVAVAQDRGNVPFVRMLSQAREALKEEMLPRIQNETDRPALEPMLAEFESTVLREVKPAARSKG